jgi:hypothetical protein
MVTESGRKNNKKMVEMGNFPHIFFKEMVSLERYNLSLTCARLHVGGENE